MKELETRVEKLEFALGVDDDGPEWVVVRFGYVDENGNPSGESDPAVRYSVGRYPPVVEYWNAELRAWQPEPYEQGANYDDTRITE